MNVYIDESGSINYKLGNKPFVISIIHVLDHKKMSNAYKRFVSSNLKRLRELDKDYCNSDGVVTKNGNQMFKNDKFMELKGSQFDPEMKKAFVDFITKKKYFELYYIKINNELLSNSICKNTARAFNYTLKLALTSFIENKMFPDEDCLLQLDERNERTDAKFFLENYLNTELCLSNVTDKHFSVKYLNSESNPFIQVADVFANFYYSQLNTNAYSEELCKLKDRNILKTIYEFPKKGYKN